MDSAIIQLKMTQVSIRRWERKSKGGAVRRKGEDDPFLNWAEGDIIKQDDVLGGEPSRESKSTGSLCATPLSGLVPGQQDLEHIFQMWFPCHPSPSSFPWEPETSGLLAKNAGSPAPFRISGNKRMEL